MRFLRGIFFCMAMLAAVTANAGLFSASFVVEVSALSRSAPAAGTTYVVVPADSKKAGTLEFRDVAKHVERALRRNGLVLADSAAAADATIVVDYGISEPIKTTTETQDKKFKVVGPPVVPGGLPEYDWVKDGRPEKTTVTSFKRWLKITAKDNHKNAEEVWIVDATSTGFSDDLREIVAAMALAGSKYVGKDTGKKIAVSVGRDSKELRAFREEPQTLLVMADSAEAITDGEPQSTTRRRVGRTVAQAGLPSLPVR